jgi:2',3'-cyclic-nucleotide 2'-phosphodiesterase (5'-nucleotidase family)
VQEQRDLAEYLLFLDTGDALIAEQDLKGLPPGDDMAGWSDFDTGDAPYMDGNLERQMWGEDIVAGMNLMGYDAMALGPLDLGLGAKILKQRLDEAEFPMLSANVLWSGDHTLVGEPYTIVQIGPYRIGVIGLTRYPNGELADYEILEPKEVLVQLVPEVEGQVDMVILLTNMSYRSVMELVEAVPGIDLAVAALPRQLPDRAVRTPQTRALVVTADQALRAHSGRRVGRLVVMVGRDGALSREAWVSVAMGPEIADDPDMKALLDRFRE